MRRISSKVSAQQLMIFELAALEQRVGRWRRIGWVAAITVTLAVITAVVANWRARVAADTQAKEAKLLEQARNSLARAEFAERESDQQLKAALFEQARALVLSKELGHRTRALEAIARAAQTTNVAGRSRRCVGTWKSWGWTGNA